MTNPVDIEIVHHLAEELEQADGLEEVEVFKGWVPNDDFETPSISIVSGDVDRQDTHGKERQEDLGDGRVAVYFRDTNISLPLTLELYTTSKTERMELSEPVRKVFHPAPEDGTSGPPDRSLKLTLDKHHSVGCWVYLRNDDPSDNEGVNEGYYRKSYTLLAESAELTRYEYDRAEFDTTTEVH